MFSFLAYEKLVHSISPLTRAICLVMLLYDIWIAGGKQNSQRNTDTEYCQDSRRSQRKRSVLARRHWGLRRDSGENTGVTSQ